MADASGKPITELLLHGLKAIPASGADFLPVATLEEIYSNNLGFYNQVFHIYPKSGSTAAQATTPPAGEVGAQITAVGSAARRVKRGERTLVAAPYRTYGPIAPTTSACRSARAHADGTRCIS
jgi:hypothetical protein